MPFCRQRRHQFLAPAGVLLLHHNLQNYLDIVLKKEMEEQEFLSNSGLTGLSVSNSVVNVVPALRNANLTSTPNPAGLAANPSTLNYTEPAYWQVSSVAGTGANAGMSYVVQFPLKFIRNTLFSIDKNLYFAQTTYLKCYFGPTSKICYASTSNANPSAGTKASYLPQYPASIGPSSNALAPYLNGVTAINFQLMLAVETNQDLRTMTINKVATSGLSYLIPYVQAYKNSNTGTTQNISIQLDQGNGRSFMKVYHAPYNSQEDFDTMYDHANTGFVSGAAYNSANQKVLTYYTQLNGKRNQDITLDCTYNGPFTDYMQHKRQLKGGVLGHLNVYQQNWFHCDDWTDFGSRYDQDNTGELVSGIPMSVAPLTWSFIGLTMNAANITSYQHYTWFVFIKKLTMTPGTVLVQ